MFTKILIANRGEIAVRVISACADRGIASVAVHSEADANSYHVRLADESVSLGPGGAKDNYLNGTALIEAALATGSDAIHPGYGFLSENADFAEAVVAAGLTFIGPPADAIRSMGEKVAARSIAGRAEVPLVPGSAGPVTRHDEAEAFGEQHGYPILVKASHGGGGRGMRLIERAEDAIDAMDAAIREATAAFGNGEVYLERYLTRARHIEVQVFADSHGNAIWIGDRDCSVQRRHQKLVEESPAPGIDAQLRIAMGEAAVRLAREVDYRGAGTVEFLVEDERFYFLEMNTRIQVEHPVTELVQGIDLIAEQIAVAAGEPLSIAGSGPTPRGHAIEARINAEDVAGGRFVPSPGVIRQLTVPLGPGVRFDSGYEAGDEVLPLYDSLIGKLIVWGADRDAAIRRMRSALRSLEVVGVQTTAPAALAVLEHPDFEAGGISTGWLESEVDFADNVGPVSATGEPAEPSEFLDRSEVEVNGRLYTIPFFSTAPAAGGTASAEAARPARSTGRRATGKRRGGVAQDGKVIAPMQGTIVKVSANDGDLVDEGALLFVLEAMKMENPIFAPISGVLGGVAVSVGDSPSAGSLLALVSAVEG